ncbi:MAG: hypothetical protein AAF310_00055 [Myxococcota bacterium]
MSADSSNTLTKVYPGQEHTLQIEKLAFGGQGVAYLQGKRHGHHWAISCPAVLTCCGY